MTNTTRQDVPASFPAGYSRASVVADAILYEGYLLYPYRKSAAKNRLRWQFGVLAPREWAQANLPVDESVAGSAESYFQQTECLVERATRSSLSIRLRFLHSQQRTVLARTGPDSYDPAPELEIDGRRVLSFDEAVPQERDLVMPIAALLSSPYRSDLDIPGVESSEDLLDESGGLRGRVARTRCPLRLQIEVSAARVDAPFPLLRIRVRTQNLTAGLSHDAPRTQALSRSLLAAHTFLALDEGKFISRLDPPQWASSAAKECTSIHTFPVLAGDGEDLVLSSPIILYDHPQIAPESPGDLFDAGEIDEILSLRVLTMTDQEQDEARATDPRAAQILDRVQASAPDEFAGLHGTIRPSDPKGVLAQAVVADERPWWEPGADADIAPETDCVLVAGVAIGKGSRVRLRPRAHGSDVHDMFLSGRYALVESVLTDVDGSRFIAVSVEDDPAAELHKALGRFFHFTPDEVEPTAEPTVEPTVEPA